MTDPADKLPVIAAATDRLLATARTLSPDDVRRPSLLPGWTVGHVLTHIARNADGLGNLARWARTGTPSPMYASPESRDADIAAGADRTPAELTEDLADAAERLRTELEAMPRQAWDVVIEWRGGVRNPAGVIPSARLTEVEIHHADLGLGFGFGDIGEDLRLRLLADAVKDWTEVAVHADDTGRSWPEDPGTLPVVTGSSGDLLGWATGRTDGARLRHDGELPAVPEWR